MGQDHEPSPADTLNRASDDERRHGGGESADNGPHQEDGESGDEQALAPDEISEFAVDRHHDGGRHQVGGGDPQHVVNTT